MDLAEKEEPRKMCTKEGRDRGTDAGRIKEEENRGSREVGNKSSMIPKRGKASGSSFQV